MSATNRGAARRINDAYFTPPILARAICRRLQKLLPAPESILEPSAGNGAFVSAAVETWPNAAITGMDIKPLRKDIERSDFLRESPRGTWQMVLGNPPFGEAERFVRRALETVPDGGHVAFLLRTCFLHGQERAKWVIHDLRWLIPLAERPSFTGDGKTDSADYSVFVWRRGYDPTFLLPALFWRSEPSK